MGTQTGAAVRTVDLDTIRLRDCNAQLHDPGEVRHWRIVNPRGRHSVAVGLDAPLEVEIEGHVGYYCAGMNRTPPCGCTALRGRPAENIMSFGRRHGAPPSWPPAAAAARVVHGDAPRGAHLAEGPYASSRLGGSLARSWPRRLPVSASTRRRAGRLDLRGPPLLVPRRRAGRRLRREGDAPGSGAGCALLHPPHRRRRRASPSLRLGQAALQLPPDDAALPALTIRRLRESGRSTGRDAESSAAREASYTSGWAPSAGAPLRDLLFLEPAPRYPSRVIASAATPRHAGTRFARTPLDLAIRDHRRMSFGALSARRRRRWGRGASARDEHDHAWRHDAEEREHSANSSTSASVALRLEPDDLRGPTPSSRGGQGASRRGACPGRSLRRVAEMRDLPWGSIIAARAGTRTGPPRRPRDQIEGCAKITTGEADLRKVRGRGLLHVALRLRQARRVLLEEQGARRRRRTSSSSTSASRSWPHPSGGRRLEELGGTHSAARRVWASGGCRRRQALALAPTPSPSVCALIALGYNAPDLDAESSARQAPGLRHWTMGATRSALHPGPRLAARFDPVLGGRGWPTT